MSTKAGQLHLIVIAHPTFGQTTFKKAELRTEFSLVKQGKKGNLVVDTQQILFRKKNGEPYFSIPTGSVKDIFYSRVSGRRIGAAVLISPFLLFSKGRKHYMTLSFNDGKNMAGAIEFKLHKSNYRSCLRAVEQVTGLTMSSDQEGVKESEQSVSKRKDKKN